MLASLQSNKYIIKDGILYYSKHGMTHRYSNRNSNTNMDKCRLCLKSSKNLRSIFAKEDGVLYIDMIKSISSIKIKSEDEVTNLCSQCRRKLKEAYDFKNMIELSDSVFSKDALRRINFNNLDEIKIKVEIDVKKEINKSNSIISVLDSCAYNGEEFTLYNTIIRKVKPNNTVCSNKILNLCDYLESFKYEPNYDDHVEHDYDCKDMSDDEYLPDKNKNKKEKSSKGKENQVAKRPNKFNMVPEKVFIKPVFLEDIGIIRTKVQIHRRRKPKSTTKKSKQMCNYCGIMTSSMKSHLLTHGTKTHKCDKCDKAFFTLGRLQHHQIKHEENRKYKCDHCVAKFHDLSALTRHLAVHNEEKTFVCEICNKSYKRTYSLNRHKLQHNSANKNIKCDHCNMTFFTKVSLRHHLRVHTGERPFRCEMCSQGYSYKHDFNRHCFKKHGVFLKRRPVYVMNEEVLVKERELMRALMLRLRGVVQGEDPFKEFEGPQGYMGLQQAIKLLENKQLPVEHY